MRMTPTILMSRCIQQNYNYNGRTTPVSGENKENIKKNQKKENKKTNRAP